MKDIQLSILAATTFIYLVVGVVFLCVLGSIIIISVGSLWVLYTVGSLPLSVIIAFTVLAYLAGWLLISSSCFTVSSLY